MMQSSRINLEQATLSLLQEIPANSDRFRNEFAQRVASESTSIKTDQLELFTPVSRNEDRRNPPAQTARRAVTVNLPLAGIHHAQIALAVYDLAVDRHNSYVASRFLNCGRRIGHGDRTRCYFHHCSALTIDQLALETDVLATEAGHEIVGPMFSWRDQ